jgi:transposase
MPKRGLRLDLEEYNHIVHRRYLAKKRKDLEARIRLRAILLVHEGKTLGQVGKILEVARSTVQRWIERYRRRGVTGLLVRGPYRGKKPRLSLDQKRELAIVIQQGPENSGMDTGVWTSPIIVDLVKLRFRIAYSPSQIRRILHELGFSLQYPRQELSKADKKRQATWLEEELPEIKKKSKRMMAS